MDAPAEADPVEPLQQVAEARLDPVQHGREVFQASVLAVVVDHHAADAVEHGLDAGGVGLAQAAVGAGGVGQQVGRVADAGIQAQAQGRVATERAERFELADRVEDQLVGVTRGLADLVTGPGDAVAVRLPTELLGPQPDLVQGRRGRAIEVFAHQPEHRPGGKALECQQRPGTGSLAQAGHGVEVATQRGLVDQVEGGRDGHSAGQLPWGRGGMVPPGCRGGPDGHGAGSRGPTGARPGSR